MKVQIYGDSLMKGVLVDQNYKYRPIARRLLEQLQAGQYVVDVQLNTALELAHNVQTAD